MHSHIAIQFFMFYNKTIKFIHQYSYGRREPKCGCRKFYSWKSYTSDNASYNNYMTWGKVVNSYLAENSDGTLTRVEHTSGSIVAETYDANTGALRSTHTLQKELGLFGGFFNGSDYYYIVYGQKNSAEQDSEEVLRVVKYARDWSRAGSVSVYGANTYIPFDAGSLRMTETDGRLYIYTCHEMYQSSDGYHHQSNMTYVVNENAMSIEQSYYGVMNIAQAGYVSHSFNQFIQTDGTYVYRVDHGDAYPRAVSLTRCVAGGRITSVQYALPLQIGGATGVNATGVSVGGFELSSDSCLIAGNSVPQGNAFNGTSGQRNIFITVTSKDLSHTDTVWLTAYSGGTITVRTPQLTKTGENQFLLMWEEYNNDTRDTVTKVASIDGHGELTADIVFCRLPLSDCKPIFCSDGIVRWYVTDNSSPRLYAVNPYGLDTLPTDTEPAEPETPTDTPEPTESATPTPGLMPTDMPTAQPMQTQNIKNKYSGTIKRQVGSSLMQEVTGANTEVTFESSNPKVARVGKTSGIITCAGVGETVITSKAAQSGSYKAASQEFTLRVIPKTAGVKSVRSNKKGQVTVKSDNAAKGNDGYQIQYKHNGKTKKADVKGSKSITRTFKNLKSGKNFKVRIRAYKKTGGITYYGDYSNWKTLKKVK